MRPLSSMQKLIADHLIRFFLTTRLVLHRRFYEDRKINAVSKAVHRMHKRGLITRHELSSRFHFYRLGPNVRNYYQVPPRLLKMPGPQMENDLAILRYCCLGPRRLDRLRPDELTEVYPDFPESELRQGWYVDPKQGALGRFVLIPSYKAVKHLVGELRSLLNQYLETSSLRSLISEGRFLFVLMTYRPEQARTLKEALAKEDWSLRTGFPPLTIRAHALPQED